MKKYYKLLWKEILARLFFHIIYMSAIAALPYVIKNMIDCGFSNGIYDVAKWIGIFVFFVMIGMAAQYITQKSAWKLDRKFYEKIRQDYFCATIQKLPEEYNKKEIGEYASVITNDIASCEEYIEYTMEVCESIIGLTVYAIYIFMLDIRIAVIIYITAVLALFLPRVTGNRLSQKKQHMLGETGRYTNTVLDLLKGFSFIDRFTVRPVSETHKKSLLSMEKARYEYGKFKTFTNVLNGSVMYIVNTAAFGIIAFLLSTGSISAGIAAATISYIQDFMFPLRTIIDSVSAVKSVEGVKTRVIKEIAEGREIPFRGIPFTGEIKMNQVSVKRDGFELRDCCLCFRKGKSYAVVGNSGTGKSTLVKLLTQRIRQDEGQVTIDGVPADYDLCNELMFYSEQNSYVYTRPYEDNATVFGSYEYSKIIQEITGDRKYESIYEIDNCNELSGGEKQIVLASRAILSGKEILVLDEPFSALSAELEARLTKEILALGKTVIMVTHNRSEEYLKLFDYTCDGKNGSFTMNKV